MNIPLFIILTAIWFAIFQPIFGIKSIQKASNRLLIWQYEKVSLIMAIYRVLTENNTSFAKNPNRR